MTILNVIINELVKSDDPYIELIQIRDYVDTMLKVPPLPFPFRYNILYRLKAGLKPNPIVDFFIPACSEFTVTDRHIDIIEIDVVDKDGSIYKYFGTTKVWVSIEDLRKCSEEVTDGHIIGRNQ